MNKKLSEKRYNRLMNAKWRTGFAMLGLGIMAGMFITGLSMELLDMNATATILTGFGAGVLLGWGLEHYK